MYMATVEIQIFQTVPQLVYHFAWGPMRDKPVLVGCVATRLAGLLLEKAEALEVHILHLEILPNRVYAAVAAPPTLAPHQIVCGLKAHTSGVLRREFTELTTMPTLWTRHYLVLAGASILMDELLAAFEATLAPRRPRGRPAACPHAAESDGLND